MLLFQYCVLKATRDRNYWVHKCIHCCIHGHMSMHKYLKYCILQCVRKCLLQLHCLFHCYMNISIWSWLIMYTKTNEKLVWDKRIDSDDLRTNLLFPFIFSPYGFEIAIKKDIEIYWNKTITNMNVNEIDLIFFLRIIIRLKEIWTLNSHTFLFSLIECKFYSSWS